MFIRHAARAVTQALTDTPVVFVMGARQVGKTTLIRHLIDERWQYITFDDLAQAELARADPVGLIRNFPAGWIALDEVQRVPDTLVAIKQAVDEDRTPGRFLLTGSTNAMLLPAVSDALVGRVETVRLSTLSECEIGGTRPTFLARVLAGDAPVADEVRIRDRLIQRSLDDLPRIEHIDSMHRLLRLTALLSGQLINLTTLGGKLGLSRITAGRYLALLEQLFLVERIPAWYSNESKRLVKTPKLHTVDTGMMCALRGITRVSQS